MRSSTKNRDPKGAGGPAARAKASPAAKAKAKTSPAAKAKTGTPRGPKGAAPTKPPRGDEPNVTRSRHPDVQLDHDVLEFIEALNCYKREHGTPFPSWSEVLHVLRSLGYRKSASH